MRLLLDTAALIYAANSPDRLSNRASVALRNRNNILEVSAISLTEIALKSSVHKLAFSKDTLRQVLKELDIRVLTYAADHAFQLFDLPVHHRDPFDRQIIAQALWEKMTVVTPDREFGMYDGLNIIW